jgi:hypothetical protein
MHGAAGAATFRSRVAGEVDHGVGVCDRWHIFWRGGCCGAFELCGRGLKRIRCILSRLFRSFGRRFFGPLGGLLGGGGGDGISTFYTV